MRRSPTRSSSRYTENTVNDVSRAISCGSLCRSSSKSRTDVTSRPSSNKVASNSVSELLAGNEVSSSTKPSWEDDVMRWPKYTEPFVSEHLLLPLDYAAIERILPHRYPFLL